MVNPNPAISTRALTRNDIAEQVRLITMGNLNKLGVHEARDLVDATMKVITDALSVGRSVELRGVFTMHVVQAAARQAQNPKTGGKVEVPARKRVKFKLSSEVKLPA